MLRSSRSQSTGCRLHKCQISWKSFDQNYRLDFKAPEKKLSASKTFFFNKQIHFLNTKEWKNGSENETEIKMIYGNVKRIQFCFTFFISESIQMFVSRNSRTCSTSVFHQLVKNDHGINQKH